MMQRHFYLINVVQIRGTGLILGTEFSDNKSPNDPFPPEWGKFLCLFFFSKVSWNWFSSYAWLILKRCI